MIGAFGEEPSEKIEKQHERGISGLREVGDCVEERGIFVIFEDAITEAGELLYHIQIGENDRGTPGTGSIRWDGIANAIKEIGYYRWLVIETFPPWYEGVSACVWRPLAPDQDEIARGGLQFLRRLLGSGV
jgi:sugar phosphate isomerase/epimerase